MKVDNHITSSLLPSNKMGNTCILTDSTAQFPKSNFQGQSFITVMPLEPSFSNQEGQTRPEDEKKQRELPESADDSLLPYLRSPSPEKIRQMLASLSRDNDEVLGILLSSQLNPCFSNMQEAVASLGLKERVQLIDSQSTSVGLGYIVEIAANMLNKGESLINIKRFVYDLISRIYFVICCPGLTYLYYNGFLDYAQANIGEMLNLFSLFALEDGKLIPLEKMRNFRQVIDYYQEFLGEFDRVEYIGIIQSNPQIPSMSRYLREYLKNNFPNAAYSEHKINLPLATLFGPASTGVILIEQPNH